MKDDVRHEQIRKKVFHKLGLADCDILLWRQPGSECFGLWIKSVPSAITGRGGLWHNPFALPTSIGVTAAYWWHVRAMPHIQVAIMVGAYDPQVRYREASVFAADSLAGRLYGEAHLPAGSDQAALANWIEQQLDVRSVELGHPEPVAPELHIKCYLPAIWRDGQP